MQNKVISFSSKFGKPEKFNSQFHKVKLYVAYAGKNRNGSFISKETFEKIIPSLYGVPVVGEWKGEDFGSHGGKVEISEEGVEFIDTTKPYGYIDSSANVQWETITEESGETKEYLTTDAFLWTSRYPEALKVLDDKNNQSMEINVFDGKMLEEDEQYFEITDGEFSALCILGEEVEPCFESAKVSQFSLDKDKFKSEFNLMIKELKQSMFEGGESVEENKDKEVAETEDAKEEVAKNAVEEVAEETTKDAVEDVVKKDATEDDYKLKYEELLTSYDNLKSEKETLQKEYSVLEIEVESLREFKSTKDKEEFDAEQEKLKQEKIDHINTEYANVSDEVREMFISEVDKYETIENIDTDICVYIVKNKLSFSNTKEAKQSSVKLGVEGNKEEFKASPYGDLF